MSEQGCDKSARQVIKELRDALSAEKSQRLSIEADAARLLATYEATRGELRALRSRIDMLKEADPEIWLGHFSPAAERRQRRAATAQSLAAISSGVVLK